MCSRRRGRGAVGIVPRPRREEVFDARSGRVERFGRRARGSLRLLPVRLRAFFLRAFVSERVREGLRGWFFRRAFRAPGSEEGAEARDGLFERRALAQARPEPFREVSREPRPPGASALVPARPAVPFVREDDRAVVVPVPQAPPDRLVERPERLQRVPPVPREQAPGPRAVVVVSPLQLHPRVLDVRVRDAHDDHRARVRVGEVDPLGNLPAAHREQNRAARRGPARRGGVGVRRGARGILHAPVIFREELVQGRRRRGGGTPAAAPAAASSPPPASPPAAASSRPRVLAVVPRLLEDALPGRSLDASPRARPPPPLGDALERGVRREKHQRAVGNLLAPPLERVPEIVLVRELGRALIRPREPRAGRTDAHGPGPHLPLRVHAVRRLGANRKRRAELGRERVERRQRPGRKHHAPRRARHVPERQRGIHRPERKRRLGSLVETGGFLVGRSSLEARANDEPVVLGARAPRVRRRRQQNLRRLERVPRDAPRRGRLRVVRLLRQTLHRLPREVHALGREPRVAHPPGHRVPAGPRRLPLFEPARAKGTPRVRTVRSAREPTSDGTRHLRQKTKRIAGGIAAGEIEIAAGVKRAPGGGRRRTPRRVGGRRRTSRRVVAAARSHRDRDPGELVGGEDDVAQRDVAARGFPRGVLDVVRLVEDDEGAPEVHVHRGSDARVEEVVVRTEDELGGFAHVLGGEVRTPPRLRPERDEILHVRRSRPGPTRGGRELHRAVTVSAAAAGDY